MCRAGKCGWAQQSLTSPSTAEGARAGGHSLSAPVAALRVGEACKRGRQTSPSGLRSPASAQCSSGRGAVLSLPGALGESRSLKARSLSLFIITLNGHHDPILSESEQGQLPRGCTRHGERHGGQGKCFSRRHALSEVWPEHLTTLHNPGVWESGFHPDDKQHKNRKSSLISS